MKQLRWICAGVLVGLAGVVALAIATAPSRSAVATIEAPTVSSVAVVPSAAPVVATARPVTRPVPAPAKPAVEGIVPGTAGMLIGIDPETGEAGMPTPEQIAEMHLTEDEMVSKDDGVTVTRQGNMQIMSVQGRFQEYAVVRKAANGGTVTGCVDDPNLVDQFQPAKKAALEEE